MIIDVTGASSYHGFLPVLVRMCIATLTSPQPDGQPFPLSLATALFSFLYHLASYEAGGEALVSCGMMESLLKVINWPGSELEHITVSSSSLVALYYYCFIKQGIQLMSFIMLCFAVCDEGSASDRFDNKHRHAGIPSTRWFE